MSRIYFYAAPEDQLAFRDYVDSLGLIVFPSMLRLFGRTPPTRKDQFGGYISILPADRLHPYHGYNRKRRRNLFKRCISDVSDPLIYWMPSTLREFGSDQYLIQGMLEWQFNDPNRKEEAAEGKRAFGRLRRWIRQNWVPAAKGHTCRGPEAQRLIQYHGVLPRGLPPDCTIENVNIGNRANDRAE